MDFNNSVYGTIPIFGGNEIWISDSIVTTWIVGGFLIVFAIIIRILLSMDYFKAIPRNNFQNIVEMLVEAMDNFCVTTMGKVNRKFGAYFFGVFAFIMCSNLSGLINLRPATADLATNVPLALVTFILINYCGITKQKSAYWKSYFEPVFLFLPINIISAFTPPIALSFRLFGNMLGGVIIMGLYYGLLPIFLKLGIPAVLHFYFDLFAGILQAFIFVILSMTFIKEKIPD